MAKCPSCPDQILRHTLLAEGLAALGCDECKGALLSLVTYRRWHERLGSVPTQQAPARAVEDSRTIVQCPKCRGLMTKFRISGEINNRIDFCAHCEEIWLDGGEWPLLEPLARAGELFTIVTRPWQHTVRENTRDGSATRRLREVLGDDYDEFVRVREWLDEHPARDFILAQLHHREH